MRCFVKYTAVYHELNTSFRARIEYLTAVTLPYTKETYGLKIYAYLWGKWNKHLKVKPSQKIWVIELCLFKRIHMPSADPKLFKNLAFPLCSVLNNLKHLGCPGLRYNQCLTAEEKGMGILNQLLEVKIRYKLL